MSSHWSDHDVYSHSKDTAQSDVEQVVGGVVALGVQWRRVRLVALLAAHPVTARMRRTQETFFESHCGKSCEVTTELDFIQTHTYSRYLNSHRHVTHNQKDFLGNYVLCIYILTSVTGRVGSVTTSAVKSVDASAKSLDASAKSLDASAKYFGHVSGVLVTSAAQDWLPRQGYHIGDTFFDTSTYNICRLGT